MKAFPWFGAALILALLGGVTYFATGLLMPGRPEFPQSTGAATKSFLAEANKRSDLIRKKWEETGQDVSRFQGLRGTENEHRVFVSTTLVYLPQNPEPVQPLDRKMKTDDGMEIGWKMRYGFDPSDPDVKDQDPDGDGFTNLEEYSAEPSTDPWRKDDSPAKESKLKSRSGEEVAMKISFPEKFGGGISTVRFQVGPKRRELRVKPGDRVWVMAGPDNLEAFSDEPKMTAARQRAKDSGLNDHVIPIQILSYTEKIEKVRDAKAGGIEVELDNSELVLERKDAIAEVCKLTYSTAQRVNQLTWDVGEVRFFSPVGGGKELGPYRVGQVFSFEGKEFTIRKREGRKVELINRADPQGKAFWIPPDSQASGVAPGS